MANDSELGVNKAEGEIIPKVDSGIIIVPPEGGKLLDMSLQVSMLNQGRNFLVKNPSDKQREQFFEGNVRELSVLLDQKAIKIEDLHFYLETLMDLDISPDHEVMLEALINQDDNSKRIILKNLSVKSLLQFDPEDLIDECSPRETAEWLVVSSYILNKKKDVFHSTYSRPGNSWKESSRQIGIENDLDTYAGYLESILGYVFEKDEDNLDFISKVIRQLSYLPQKDTKYLFDSLQELKDAGSECAQLFLQQIELSGLNINY